MKKIPALLVLTIFLSCGIFHGVRAEDAKEDAAYLSLVDKAMKDPASINWTELRTLYTQTSFYKPYAGMVLWPEFDAAGKAAAMQGGAENLKKFQDMQKEQYANYKSHIDAIDLATVMGARAAFVNKALEQQALEGIADSIVASGDGKSPDKAFKVITSEEEDLIVGTYLGSKMKRHQEAEKDGHHFEILYYANKDPKEKKDGMAIFNIDVQYAHEQAAASAFPSINK